MPRIDTTSETFISITNDNSKESLMRKSPIFKQIKSKTKKYKLKTPNHTFDNKHHLFREELPIPMLGKAPGRYNKDKINREQLQYEGIKAKLSVYNKRQNNLN